MKRLLLLLLLPTLSQATVDLSLIITPQFNQYQNQGVFALPATTVEQNPFKSNQVLELQTDYKGFNLLANIDYQVATNQSNNQKSLEQNTKGSTLEAYFAHSYKDVEMAIGKKITSWGVAYGYRPTDIIANKDLQTLQQTTQAGVAQLIAEYFSDLSSYSLVLVPSSNQGDLIALRYFNSAEQGDYQMLIAHSENWGTQLGGAGVWIANDETAYHFELMLQEMFQQSINPLVDSNSTVPLSTSNPFSIVQKKQASKLLAGLNFSTGNHNLIAEYWYDGTAYSLKQWQKLFTLANKQRSLLGTNGLSDNAIYGNLAFNLTASQAPQLMQHNVFVRWAYQFDNWIPSIDMLIAPEDKGTIFTFNALKDTDWFKLNAGIRLFTGDSESVYAQLLIKNQIYFILSRDF